MYYGAALIAFDDCFRATGTAVHRPAQERASNVQMVHFQCGFSTCRLITRDAVCFLSYAELCQIRKSFSALFYFQNVPCFDFKLDMNTFSRGNNPIFIIRTLEDFKKHLRCQHHGAVKECFFTNCNFTAANNITYKVFASLIIKLKHKGLGNEQNSAERIGLTKQPK